ncbi:MAG TPA: hypothetical protein VGD67_04375 [Pseudonocardiaceae bacterium]
MIDTEKSSDRSDPEQLELRAALRSAVDGAFRASGVPAGRVELHDRGDGLMILVDGRVPRPTLVARFTTELTERLGRHNRRAGPERWLRVRLALHAGDARRDEHGWTGRDLTHTFRLCEADAVKRCLEAAARAQCVLVTSDHFYRSVVAHGDDGVDPASYRSVDLTVGGELGRAWLHVPGYRVPPVPDPPSATAGHAGLAAAARAAALLAEVPPGTTLYAPGRDYLDLRHGGVVHHHPR